MSQSPRLYARSFAAAHAVAELALAHFQETGFSMICDQHLARLVPIPVPNQAELCALVGTCGMRVSEDLLVHMLTANASSAVEAQQMRWCDLQQLLLRGFEVGMTALTAYGCGLDTALSENGFRRKVGRGRGKHRVGVDATPGARSPH